MGGGAAGMTAAIFAAERGAGVLLLEHMEQIGKKILVTGNGKCNYTNRMQEVSHYRGDEPAFVMSAFAQFGLEQTLAFFEELGIYPKEKNGYFYPASEQASSVLEVMKMRLQRLGVTIHCGVGIRSIEKRMEASVLTPKADAISGKTVSLRPVAMRQRPEVMEAVFIYAKKFGHHLSEPVPALVQLVAKSPFEKMAGVRTAANVKVFADGVLLHQDTGEVQLTDYGISGIPVFQVSRFAAKALAAGKEVCAYLDFFPTVDETALTRILKNRFYQSGIGKSAKEALVGLFADKLSGVFLKRSQIAWDMPAERVTDAQLAELNLKIRQFEVKIARTNKFDAAQVTAGGILTKEINDKSMESRLVPGLFFAGEMIDIDGECGGYNLQWAWSSGAVAGCAAAERAGKECKKR